ncbi:hypothetical protein [Streptomyces sp. NPDC005303]
MRGVPGDGDSPGQCVVVGRDPVLTDELVQVVEGVGVGAAAA